VTRRRHLTQAARVLQECGRSGSARTLTKHVCDGGADLPDLRVLVGLAKARGESSPGYVDWSGYGSVTNERPRCMTIFDPISDLSWSTDFNCQRFGRGEAREQASTQDYDFVVMESVWRGHKDDWIYAFSFGMNHAHSKALIDLLEYLRTTINKPIVMINKEDPLHFDRFLPVMKYADHIFTTDEGMIDDYRQKLLR
jgi:hypothetical protein